MTQPSEAVVVDGDRVDQGRRPWLIALAALIAGAILGALAGGLYGASQTSDYQADTALSVQPDPTLNLASNTSSNSTTGPASLDATAYIQSQLVVINGHQLADTVQQRLGLGSRPSYTATQVGETYVVQIRATAGDRAEGLRVARAVGVAYDRIRTRQLNGEINGLLASTRSQLASTQQSLTAASRAAGRDSGNSPSPSQTALQTQYEQLLSNQSYLQASQQQVGKIVTVVSPASIATAGLSTTASDALAGLVIGAILGLVLVLIVRRSRHRVRGVSDLATLGVPVLLPVQPRRSIPGPAFWRGPAARVLSARLHADTMRLGGPLVVAGATRRAGTSQVAATVAAALTGRGPVLFVTGSQFPESADSSFGPPNVDLIDDRRVPVAASTMTGVWLLDPADQDPSARLVDLVRHAAKAGWLVVVDAGTVSDSDLAVQLARADAVVTLVVGRGVSSPADVLAATELFEAEGMSNPGAVLNNVPGVFGRRFASLIGRRPPTIEVLPAANGSETRSAADSSLLLDLGYGTDVGQAGGHRLEQNPAVRSGAAGR